MLVFILYIYFTFREVLGSLSHDTLSTAKILGARDENTDLKQRELSSSQDKLRIKTKSQANHGFDRNSKKEY